MKNIYYNLFKFFIFSFVLLSNVMMYSQFPGDDTSGGDLEGGDAPAAPINSQLILLALAGVIYAVYAFKNNRRRV